MNNMIRQLCLVTLCLSLAACLPGKEQEKKVIQQSTDAQENVQVEKIAADMANTARTTMGNVNAQIVDSQNLKTIPCKDASGKTVKVVSYIPNTATFLKGGKIPDDLASRMRNDLEKKFSPSNLINAANIDSLCGVDVTTIALNSPILTLDSTFAEAQEKPKDQTQVVEVSMEACQNGKPGVTVVKKFADGHSEQDSHCGPAAISAKEAIALATQNMPDWKERLKTGGNILATANFSCIAGTDGCNPVDPAQLETMVQCSQQPNLSDLMINPSYDGAKAEFKADATNRDCGKGWEGELTAHIEKKDCRIIRNGVPSELPATVFNVSYVAAKCRKAGVTTLQTCPIGSPFETTGHVMRAQDAVMLQPLVLKVDPNNDTSTITYKRSENGQLLTNSDTFTDRLASSPQNLLAPEGQRTESMFLAQSNLSAVASNDFDQHFVDEMEAMGKLGNQNGYTCFTKGQNCLVDFPPSEIDITVDRSIAMSNPAGATVYAKRTTCHATMANLFIQDKRVDACRAVKGYLEVARQNQELQNSIDHWKYDQEPVNQGNEYLQRYEEMQSENLQQALSQYKYAMTSALKSPKLVERLNYALAIGQDCNPGLTADGRAVKTQEDMFGTCAPQYVADEDVLTLFSPDTANIRGKVLKTCQSGCPGECITDVERDSSYRPLGKMMSKMAAVDMYVKNDLVPRLPLNARTTYAEIINKTPDNATAPVGHQPIVLQDKLGDDLSQLADANKTYYWAEASEKLDKKSKQRGKDVAGDWLPLYRGIDEAIGRLRKGSTGTNGLDGPDVPDPARPGEYLSGHLKRTSMVLFASGFDTDCEKRRTGLGDILNDIADFTFNAGYSNSLDQKMFAKVSNRSCKQFYQSPYFGRNFCSPEQVPTGYKCNYCSKRVLGVCVKRKDANIPAGAVQKEFGIEGNQTRANWCGAHGYGRDVEVKAQGYTNKYDNENSFVGFMARNFPRTRLYLFDSQAEGGISKFCTNDPNVITANGVAPAPYEILPGIKVTKAVPNVFFSRNNAAGDFQEWLRTFTFHNDIGHFLNEGISEATGGGEASDEAGEYICKAKFGNNVKISYLPPPKPLPERTQDFTTITDGACDPLVRLDVDAPDDMPVVVTPPPVTPYTPPTNTGGYNNEPCVNGYTTYTMRPCNSSGNGGYNPNNDPNYDPNDPYYNDPNDPYDDEPDDPVPAEPDYDDDGP